MHVPLLRERFSRSSGLGPATMILYRDGVTNVTRKTWKIEIEGFMKHFQLMIAVVLLALPSAALAEPYWVAWEGNDYPENEGWERIIQGDGPANRMLQNGVLTIDSLWSTQIADFYSLKRSVNPESGEQFVMQWRLRVNEVVGNPVSLYDPGLNVFSDDDWALTFWIGIDRIRSFHENVVIPFEPGMFHEFEVRSSDMRAYSLSIDGSLVFTGSWWEPTFDRSSVAWGDFTRGATASHHDWDYFRFGVVPEPNTLSLAILLLFIERPVILIGTSEQPCAFASGLIHGAFSPS